MVSEWLRYPVVIVSIQFSYKQPTTYDPKPIEYKVVVCWQVKSLHTWYSLSFIKIPEPCCQFFRLVSIVPIKLDMLQTLITSRIVKFDVKIKINKTYIKLFSHFEIYAFILCGIDVLTHPNDIQLQKTMDQSQSRKNTRGSYYLKAMNFRYFVV